MGPGINLLQVTRRRCQFPPHTHTHTRSSAQGAQGSVRSSLSPDPPPGNAVRGLQASAMPPLNRARIPTGVREKQREGVGGTNRISCSERHNTHRTSWGRPALDKLPFVWQRKALCGEITYARHVKRPMHDSWRPRKGRARKHRNPAPFSHPTTQSPGWRVESGRGPAIVLPAAHVNKILTPLS